MGDGNVLLEQVVPILGGFVAALLFSSSYPAVRTARLCGVLGDLNVVPFIFIMANCTSWMCYASVTKDWYVFLPNTVGLMIGAYFFLITFGLARDQKQRDNLIALVMPLTFLLIAAFATERLILTEKADAVKLWGYTANGILLCFYSSPLSTVAAVIKTRDSSSLTLPLCVMNIVNGTLWLVYGLAVGDPFIWVPNGVGACLGLFQTALCLVYAKRTTLPRSGSEVALNNGIISSMHDAAARPRSVSGRL